MLPIATAAECSGWLSQLPHRWIAEVLDAFVKAVESDMGCSDLLCNCHYAVSGAQ